MNASIALKAAQKRKMLPIITLLLIAVLSATVFSRVFATGETYRGQYEVIDEKRNNVIGLTASSAGIAALISSLPDDMCTPIAEELAEISKGFGVVIGALILEKYLLTTIGWAFFTIVIPLSCLLLAASKLMSPTNEYKQILPQAALKFFLFGLVLFLSIPASVHVSNLIDATYNETIATTIDVAEEAADVVEKTNADDAKDKQPDETPWDAIQKTFGNVGNAVNSAVEGATGALGWAKDRFSNFVELFAVMVVTSVVIPIIVPVVIYLAFKALFGQQQLVMMRNAALPDPVVADEQDVKSEIEPVAIEDRTDES